MSSHYGVCSEPPKHHVGWSRSQSNTPWQIKNKSYVSIYFFTPAHACRLIPKDVELVNRAEFAKEFTKFLLEERYIEKGRGGEQEGGNKLMWKQPQRTSSIVLGTWPTNILMASGSGPLSFVPFLIRCPFPIPSITIFTLHLFSKTRALLSVSLTLSESVRF